MYEIQMNCQAWPYKGTDEMKVKVGFNVFFYYYPKKVRTALWKYDIWDMLEDGNKLAYVQEWVESVNDMIDKIQVWDSDGGLLHYNADFDEFLQDFMKYDDWDNFVNWAITPYSYGHGSQAILKRVLQLQNRGVHLDYMEMLGNYFGSFPDQLRGEKREWFLHRIKVVYQVGDEEAEQILQGKDNE